MALDRLLLDSSRLLLIVLEERAAGPLLFLSLSLSLSRCGVISLSFSPSVLGEEFVGSS